MIVTGISLVIEKGTKVAGSVYTNPADQTVLVDTGQLTEGNYVFGFIVTNSVTVAVDIQHRNAANSANIDFIRWRAGAGSSQPIFVVAVSVATNERIRIILSGGITGEIQSVIFYQKVAL